MSNRQFYILLFAILFAPALSDMILRLADKLMYALEEEGGMVAREADILEEVVEEEAVIDMPQATVIDEATLQPGIYGFDLQASATLKN